MTNKVIDSVSRNYRARLAAMPLALLVSCLMLTVPWCIAFAISIFPESLLSREIKSLLINCFCILWLFVILPGAMFSWIAYNVRKGNAWLDQVFTPFGLTGGTFAIFGRKYTGTRRGRQVNVYYSISGGRHLRTPNLQIYVNGNFRTRLGIGEKNLLTNLGGAILQQKPLNHGDPAYQDMLIYPLDEAWSRTVLDDPSARELITRLVGKDVPGLRGLVFGPETLRLHLRHFTPDLITTQNVDQWLNDVSALAEIAERLQPPTQTAQATDAERPGRGEIGSLRLILLVVGVVGLVILCVVGVIILSAVLGIALSQSR